MTYPTLALGVRDSSFTYANGQAFVATKLAGGSSRITPTILGGWAEATLTIEFKNRAERDYFNQVFYYQETKEFTLPFKVNLLSDGTPREYVCNALSAPNHSGFKGKVLSQVSFTVEFKPYFNEETANFIASQLAAGATFSDIDEALYG